MRNEVNDSTARISAYLLTVGSSDDWKEYANHKETLKKLCSSTDEYDIAHECLIDLMEII